MNQTSQFSAIICEFNPLHYGHKRILDAARAEGRPVVCIMSGNFVQRGEAAVIDKWTRTRLALENGADLVFELPLSWAVSGAERFAMGAVQLLNALNIDGCLFFGSECGNIEQLSALADFLLSDAFSEAFSPDTQNGASFAAMREQSVLEQMGTEYAAVIRSPNNILAIEYIKAIRRNAARLKPKTILRTGAGHDLNASEGEIASAQEIRRDMEAGKNIRKMTPISTYNAIEHLIQTGRCPVSLYRLEPAILAILRKMSVSDFRELPDISEGLEHRLYAAAREACSLTDFYERVKSKRYTHARIRRLTLSAFLGLKVPLLSSPPYLRILGISPQGEVFLHTIRASLPIVVRPGHFKKIGGDSLALFQAESNADDLYALAMPKPIACGMDYRTPVVKIP